MSDMTEEEANELDELLTGTIPEADPNTRGVFMREARQAASSLLRFAHKTSKNRLQGDFLPCKLPKDAR
jgi:hypothetical protein